MDQFRAGQRLLNQQRYQFPNQWLYAEHVEGEWDALNDILMRKDSSIQSQVWHSSDHYENVLNCDKWLVKKG